MAEAADAAVVFSVYSGAARQAAEDAEYVLVLPLARWRRAAKAAALPWRFATNHRVNHALCAETVDLFDAAVEEQESVRDADPRFYSAHNDIWVELTDDLTALASHFAHAADPACAHWFTVVVVVETPALETNVKSRKVKK